MNTNTKLILLSAGGTGGHLFPAVALAQDLISRGYRVELITDNRGRKYADKFGNIQVHTISAGTLRSGLMGKITGAAAMGVGFLQARRIVDKISPSVVIGFGGYPSVPGVWAAQRKRIPTIIHQPDAVIGKANKFLAPRADRIALSFNHVEGLEEADAVRAVVTGNPVREEISALHFKPYPELQVDGPLKIFVLGGSQGANVFADVLPAAFEKLNAEHRARLDIVQQCRAEDLENVKNAYDKAGIKCRLETFFDDIPNILANTHLVISRSGASTVAEIATAGRPAIFVPYPHHKDQQQKINADVIADAGGAWVMTQDGFTPEALLTRVETFLQNPETLFRAAENARSCAKPDAARRLGNLVTAMASGWDKKASRPFDLTQGRQG